MTDPMELFTVRLWREALDESRSEWRGKIQHLGSGEVQYFRDWSKMMDFFRAVLPGGALPGLSGKPRSEADERSRSDRLQAVEGANLHSPTRKWLYKGLKGMTSPEEKSRRLLRQAGPSAQRKGSGSFASRLWRLSSFLSRLGKGKPRIARAIGFALVAAIGFIVGWHQMGVNTLKTTNLVSEATALLTSSPVLVGKVQRLRRHNPAADEQEGDADAA